MTSTPSPTWYDVLGVPRDATPDQIKTAWRTATDKFEPGSGTGQFRMFNEAADVLLDPERRAAYDATLAADDAAPAPDPAPQAAPDVVPDPAPAVVPVSPVTETELDDEPSATPAEPEPDGEPAEPAAPPRPASRALVLVTVLLALLTVAAIAVAVVLGLESREDARIADARDEAPAAAERAATAVLSYDYEQLPADRKRASAYLSDDFGKKYLENFELLEKQKDGTPGAAVQTKTVVKASVLGSGVMDAEDDKVRVLVYVNQTSTRPGRDPQIFQNRVAMTMEKDGNRWLVDDLKSY